MKRHQLVICHGPRCSHGGRPTALLERARAVLEALGPEAEGTHLGRYECFSRCPAAPNVVVRQLPEGCADPGDPGMLDLSGGHHYWAVDEPLLERLIREHCIAAIPLCGRHQKY